MALEKCKECGHQISTKATQCPSCGARIRRTSTLTKGALAFIVIATILAIVGGQQASKQSDELSAKEAARAATLTPEERKAEDAAKAAKSAREARHEQMWQQANALARAVKRGANDPASIEFVEAGYTDTGAIAITYRGKNAFNATVTNRAVLGPDGSTAAGSEREVSAAWNKHIAGKRLTDLPRPRP